MVHALREAWRVLRPGGLLLDLRPAIVHRRVGIVRAGRKRTIAVMKERFEDDVAANRAVAEAVRQRVFRQARRTRFCCLRTMDRLGEFRAWLDNYISMGKLPPHDWLLEKLQIAVRGGGARIVVSGPVELRVLQRCERR